MTLLWISVIFYFSLAREKRLRHQGQIFIDVVSGSSLAGQKSSKDAGTRYLPVFSGLREKGTSVQTKRAALFLRVGQGSIVSDFQ